MDVLAVEEATRQATALVRDGDGPVFLEFRTYRFRAHSMYDPELYRNKDEVEQWKKRDPIVTYEARLRQWGLLTDAEKAQIEAAVDAEIAEAVAFAEAGPWEPIEDLTKDVYTP
jgi:TPP-dependent pyruvate/acetoin dehydrogenase alpha subunit